MYEPFVLEAQLAVSVFSPVATLTNSFHPRYLEANAIILGASGSRDINKWLLNFANGTLLPASS